MEQARDGVVGREAELDAVDGFLAAGGSVPTALLVAGPAGIGKTTIVRAAVARAEALGLRVLRARPGRGEGELPYVGLGDLLAPLAPAALAQLAPAQRAAVEAALAREGSSVSVDEHALARGLLEVLRAEAATGKLLIVLDDVQWLDRPTSAALTFALRRVGTTPLRALVAERSEEADTTPPFGLDDWAEFRTIVVGALPATALGVLIRQRLGVQLSRPRLEAVERASGGSPLFALELVRAAETAPADSQPGTLVQTLGRRIFALDAETRETVCAAAAALRPTVDFLLRAGFPRTGLEGGVAAGILQVDGERLAFTHPLLASAADGSLLPDDRRRIHARLAEASLDAVERGHHVARSVEGRDEDAADVLDRAADAAAALGDHAGAASFLLRAAGLSSRPVERELRAAGELWLAGDIDGTTRLAAALIERLPACPERARARLLRTQASMGSTMSYDDGVAEDEAALEDAVDDDVTQAELHLDICEIMLGTCALDRALTHARQASKLAARASTGALNVAALALTGFAESMLGLGVTAASRQAVELWDGTVGTLVPPRTLLACACIPALELDEAERLLEQELAFAEERGLEQVEVLARGHLAEAQLRAGKWAEALRNARIAHEHALQAAEAQVVNGLLYALAMTLASLGEHDEARAISSEALTSADATNDFWFRISHRAVLGQVALTEDDPRLAIELLEPAWALILERGLGDLSLFPVAQTLGEALVGVGQVDEAVAIAAALRACPVGGNAWCRAMAARLEALAASARGDHASSRAAFAAALEAHADLPEPFEHARTLLLLGRAERSARGWGAARTAYLDALGRFDALGAARWSALTTADLARLPGRRPADASGLTTRQREVAALVANGLANKEIAARLHLSLRTVEANLSSVYLKLGIRSRTELAARLNRADPS
ncbi:MAG TPA: AAA family ATPase [Gaiellaceae bacterium]